MPRTSRASPGLLPAVLQASLPLVNCRRSLISRLRVKAPGHQDQASVTMDLFLQTLATQVQSMATQVESLTRAFHSVQEETGDLRRLVLTRQESPVTSTNVGTSAHFTKPARFSGKDLTTFRLIDSWTSFEADFNVRFTDKGADAKNYQRISKLKYDGDTNDYLTQSM
ncbi:hypothetical protein E4U15_003436, partial [Claviceps sp. LM218 group G6]